MTSWRSASGEGPCHPVEMVILSTGVSLPGLKVATLAHGWAILAPACLQQLPLLHLYSWWLVDTWTNLCHRRCLPQSPPGNTGVGLSLAVLAPCAFWNHFPKKLLHPGFPLGVITVRSNTSPGAQEEVSVSRQETKNVHPDR